MLSLNPPKFLAVKEREIMNLQARLQDLQKRVKNYVESGYANSMTETETRRLLIDPLIVALGWDMNDLESVRQGWRGSKTSGEQQEADYALFLRGIKKPSVLVEAKRFSADLQNDKTLTQTLMYAFINGVEWCILTNGHDVIVYDAYSHEDPRERCLFDAIDLLALGSPKGMESAAAYLEMFTPDGLRAKRPSQFRETYRLRSRVHSCLEKMLEEPDQSLIRLIRKRLENEFTAGQIAGCLNGIGLTEKEEPYAAAKDDKPPKKGKSAPGPRPRRPPRVGTKRAEKLDRWIRLNTIVCPALEEGFKETFIGENRWYAIRINAGRIPFIKYIAMYRARPVSAITHYGEVESIKAWRSSGKYVVTLKNPAKEIGPIPVNKAPNARAVPLQAPRFTTIDALLSAKTLDDCLVPEG